MRTDDDVNQPGGVWEMNSALIITLALVAVVGLGAVDDRFPEDCGVLRS